MLDPEVISSCPDLQQKLLFSWNKVRVVGQSDCCAEVAFWGTDLHLETGEGVVLCFASGYCMSSKAVQADLEDSSVEGSHFSMQGLCFLFIFPQLSSFKDFKVHYRHHTAP